MYEIRTNSGLLSFTEKPNFIRFHPDGFYLLCPEAEATGVAVNGTPYSLFGTEGLGEGHETVMVLEVDGGLELTRQAEKARQTEAAARFSVRAANVPDAVALEMPDLFLTWAEALEEGKQLDKPTILNNKGTLYRVMQAVTPQAHQEPGGEGMLAIYRPIDKDHAGTAEDPIPWVYGMDCIAGKHYSYKGHVYRVADGGDMKPCVWEPGTAGMWQWVLVN